MRGTHDAAFDQYTAIVSARRSNREWPEARLCKSIHDHVLQKHFRVAMKQLRPLGFIEWPIDDANFVGFGVPR